MKRIRSELLPLIPFFFFLVLAVASMAPKKTYYQSKPQPCTKHLPLNYSPVLVKINLSGTYTMKDLYEAQRIRPSYIIDALNTNTYPVYQLADGVTPNLNLYVTLNTDSYSHYGASITGYVYDGDFNFTINTDYVTLERLYSDLAAKVHVYVSRGWCKNCPSPCVIP